MFNKDLIYWSTIGVLLFAAMLIMFIFPVVDGTSDVWQKKFYAVKPIYCALLNINDADK